jgi:hypothetical protein
MNEKALTPLTFPSQCDARWELVQRAADSPYFRKGPKLRAFLLYVCENTILGRPENVREQLIGCKVFGRRPDYSLSDDNIVRVEARELRKRLEAYFANEGQNEPVIIEIPKGAYVPIFRPREETPSSERHEPEEALAAGAAAPARTTRWLPALLAAGLLLSLAANLWFVLGSYRLRRTANASETGGAGWTEDSSLYAKLLGSMGQLPHREPKVVLCNPKVLLYYGSRTASPLVESPERLLPAPPNLDRFFSAASNGKDGEMPYHVFLLSQTYTGAGEAMAAVYLSRLMDTLHRPVHVTQARYLNWDRVQEEDLMLLGGPSSNDWTSRIEPRSDFVFSGRSIVNVRPQPGEPKEYRADDVSGTGGPTAEYGFLKMHTTPSGFRTLLLAGLTGGGTAGVAQFFTSPAKMKPVAERIAAAARGKPFPADWQVVLKITVQDGLPLEITPVTIRPAQNAS